MILLVYIDPKPVSISLSLVFTVPDEVIFNRTNSLVLNKISSYECIFNLELLLKIVVLMVPDPISRLVIGVELPMPTFPFLSIINFKLLQLSYSSPKF